MIMCFYFFPTMGKVGNIRYSYFVNHKIICRYLNNMFICLGIEFINMIRADMG